jgi:hypothetical protein
LVSVSNNSLIHNNKTSKDIYKFGAHAHWRSPWRHAVSKTSTQHADAAEERIDVAEVHAAAADAVAFRRRPRRSATAVQRWPVARGLARHRVASCARLLRVHHFSSSHLKKGSFQNIALLSGCETKAMGVSKSNTGQPCDLKRASSRSKST